MANQIPPTSILNVLSTLPDGTTAGAMSLDELGVYLQRHYNTEAEKQRNQRHTLRDQLYRDGGDQYMREVVKEQFRDPTVRELRQKWVRHAKFNNAIKRIVNQLSTVYADPAKRSVGGSQDNNDRYQKALEALWMDEQMLQMSRLLNLHRALLVGVRVRKKPNGEREPVIDLATPAIVRAVVHPNDAKEVVAWMIRTDYRTAGIATNSGQPLPNTPAWTLWSDTESVLLREDLTVIGASYLEHPLGLIPWVPISLSPPCAGFWPGEEGEDLVAAHTAIWMNNILLLKESKSATKQAIIHGDMSTAARGQAADTETPIEAPDGSSVSTLDMSMDLAPFRETADHVLHHTALNHEISPAIMDHQGAQSAEARELQRVPLEEVRKHQQVPLRRFEQRFVVVTATVLKADLPELAFDPADFRLKFGEPRVVLSPADEMDLFLARRAAALDSTVAFLMRHNPGMTEDEAQQMIEDNISHEEARIAAMRPMMAMSGEATGGLNNGGGAQQPTPGAPAPNQAALAANGLGGVVVVPPEEKDSAPKAAAA